MAPADTGFGVLIQESIEEIEERRAVPSNMDFDELGEIEEDWDDKTHEDREDDELDEEELDEINRFKIAQRKAPERLRLRKREKAKERMKGRMDTELGKRKFQFDKKKNKFVRRDKIITKQAYKKHNRKWRRLMKRRQH